MPPASDPRPVVVYANAKSRRSREWFSQAVALLKDKGLHVEDSRLFGDPRSVQRAVEAAVQRGTSLVVVGGGDGTLSLVARHFVDSPVAMGILPLGTGNAFARDLEIPADIDDACEIIANGKTERVDLGYAGGDYFVNVATIGLSVRIVTELTDEAKRKFGRAAYFFALCRALSRVRPFHTVLSTHEVEIEFDTLQVVIGNGRYHAGPFPLAPEASITEGQLSIYALATTNRAAFFKLAWAMRTGRHCELPEVHALTTASGRLVTEPRRRVVVDGEIAASTPLEFRVAPGAIQVRVPNSFAPSPNARVAAGQSGKPGVL